MKINIAIDGPCAAGKSTIAKKIAKELGYIHLDTGAMYRSVAYKALQLHIGLRDEEALVKMIEDTDIRLTADGKVILDNEDVTETIRQNEISMAASSVSALKDVRSALVARQKKMAEDKGVIMDGRDIGTVVLKDAELKIFLTASAEARAERRCLENALKGIESDLNKITEEIKARDYQDTHREHSPLVQAGDAVVVDTSKMSIDEVCSVIIEMIKKKIGTGEFYD